MLPTAGLKMACRFCFDEMSTVENPLLSPCDCRGSIQFIHLNCLRRWRQFAESPRLKIYCQLCNAPFRIQRRWPVETLPSNADLQTGLWPFLAKPIYSIIVVFYFHVAHLLYNMKRLVESAIPYYDFDTSSFHIMIRVLGLGEVQLVVAILLGVVTFCYAIFYGQLLARVRNKWMYAKYLFAIDEMDHILMTPFLWITLSCLSFCLAILVPLPCISFYLALLPYYLRIHCVILNDMNVRGES